MNASKMLYHEVKFWDQRYQDAKLFECEWYAGYQELYSLFYVYCEKFDAILLVGNGDSTLVEDMCKDGYLDVIGMDISSKLMNRIGKQQCDKLKTNKLCDLYQYITMDVFHLGFKKKSFDVIIDKATFDGIFCQEEAKSNEKDSNTSNKSELAMLMFEQIDQCLRKNGTYIMISMYPQHVIMPYLQCKKLENKYGINWTIKHHMMTYSMQALVVRETKKIKQELASGDGCDKNRQQNLSQQEMFELAFNRSLQLIENVDFDKEKNKMPDESCVCHAYVCKKM